MIRDVPGGRRPGMHPEAYVDPAAQVIGDVMVGAGARVWPGAALRGDQKSLRGARTEVQRAGRLRAARHPRAPLLVGAGVTMTTAAAERNHTARLTLRERDARLVRTP